MEDPSPKRVGLKNRAAEILSQLEQAPLDRFSIEVALDDARVIRVALPGETLEARLAFIPKEKRMSLTEWADPESLTVSALSAGRVPQVVRIKDGPGGADESFAFQLCHTLLERYRDLSEKAAVALLDACSQGLSKDFEGAQEARLLNIRSEQVGGEEVIKAHLCCPFRLPPLKLSQQNRGVVGMRFEDMPDLGISVSSLTEDEELKGQVIKIFGQVEFRKGEREWEKVKISATAQGGLGWRTSGNTHSTKMTLLNLLIAETRGQTEPAQFSFAELREKLAAYAGRSSPGLDAFYTARNKADELLRYLLGEKAIDRSDIQEGDLILHGIPGIFGDFSLSLFRVTQIERPVEAGVEDKCRVVVTEEGAEDIKSTVVELEPSTSWFRPFSGCVMPDGRHGYLQFRSRGICLAEEVTPILTGEPIEHAPFNKEDDGNSLAYDNGEWVQRHETRDPAAIMFTKAIIKDRSLEDDYKSDPHFVRVEGDLADFTVYRRIPGAAPIKFSLPAYFKVPESMEPIFRELMEAQQALTVEDLLTLAALETT